MFLRAILIIAMATLSGCAIVPDDIEVPKGTELVSYSRAVTSGSDTVGKMARWGGVIVGVENKPQQTLIEMVHFPLNNYGKPNRYEETVGRFKVSLNGFVDPITFEEGRLVTFIGTLTGQTAGMVGEQPYMYPTIKGLDYHMWRKESSYDISPLYFNYSIGWYSPFYSPFYRPVWGIHHSRIRVIHRDNDVPGLRVRPRRVNNPAPIQRQKQPVRTPTRESRKTDNYGDLKRRK